LDLEKAFANPPERYSQNLPLNGEDWRIATDPKNEGREKGWFDAVRPEAKPTRVPWVIQEVFPGYHGVVWYWKTFDAPVNAHESGRFLLRFHAVDYLAEVWLNGERLGLHEGGETPFELDATDAIKPDRPNLLAVRVLNPTFEAIDGYALKETPHGCKDYPIKPNRTYNSGGIVDSVELLATPAIRIEDLHIIPDWQSGEILAKVNVRNAGGKPTDGLLRVTVSPAANGSPVATSTDRVQLGNGDTLAECRLEVPGHRLWSPDDPFLYRVDASLQEAESVSADQRSARCGFRDFRFEDGWFRLNGKRFFPHGNLCHPQYPVTYTMPLNEDMLRRDVVNMKALGINLCRIVFGGSTARQLDVFDELGVLVYMEHYGSWHLQESPKMAERFDRSLSEIVRRDRNHPSVVIWGALNETRGGALIRHVKENTLPLVRSLDDTRVVLLNSGSFHARFDDKIFSNPGSDEWQPGLIDKHAYMQVPHVFRELMNLRTWLGRVPQEQLKPGDKLFLSEYGQCGAIDLPRILRHFENLGFEASDDAVYFRKLQEALQSDWRHWKLDEIWPRQEDYFTASHRNLAALRRIGANAVRANPNLVAYSSTYTPSGGAFHGSGMANIFRELKPGHADAVLEETAPLRWCLFVDRVNLYRGDQIRLEALLSNRDVLEPGAYPVRIQVIAPDGSTFLDKKVDVTIPADFDGTEPPVVLPVFEEKMKIDGPEGRYRFLATLERGGAAAGGETDFHVFDVATMPSVDAEVTLWGEDRGLRDFLAKRGIRTRPFQHDSTRESELILACGESPAPGGAEAFSELARRIKNGASVVFLSPDARRLKIPGKERYATVFSKQGDDAGEHPTHYLPRAEKGSYKNISNFDTFYRADHWAKNHPVFDGLPAGGIMDYRFYRDIIHVKNICFTGITAPEEAVAGALRVSGNAQGSEYSDYGSGLMVFIDRLGDGRFLVNDLKVRQQLGTDPVAERLLRNMLNYMGTFAK
jgi:hypothetical protein